MEPLAERLERLRKALCEKASKDAHFREFLVRAPEDAIARYTGKAVPPDLGITVCEDRSRRLYIALNYPRPRRQDKDGDSRVQEPPAAFDTAHDVLGALAQALAGCRNS